MPNSVLVPVGLYWIIGATMVVSAALNAAADGSDRLAAIVFLGTVGAACLVAALGLNAVGARPSPRWWNRPGRRVCSSPARAGCFSS
ncbi:hypothetical protein GA0070608_4117 [Micromonospora peucetia]|uniref:Uncharacterized protein n=1 Tax=Micromonospora peucetia TaxID=47871 RepID=A0A1C6VTU6_9ACTN|nr:hypothetical protein GA0070608_4117 [Micromonospora peucetia]